MRRYQKSFVCLSIAIIFLLKCGVVSAQSQRELHQQIHHKMMAFSRQSPSELVPFTPINARSQSSEIYPFKRDMLNLTNTINDRTEVFNCPDSSLRKNILSGTLTHGFFTSTSTSGGGFLLGGIGRNIPDPPPYIFYGMMVKLDSVGQFLWGQELRSNGNAAVIIDQMKEMSDGTLIVAGQFNNTANGENNNFFIAKFSATGSVIWVKTFRSPVFTCTSPGDLGTRMICMQLTEGSNGDILFAGFLSDCSVSRLATAGRLSSNGNLQWCQAFRYPFVDATGFGIIQEGSAVKFFVRAGGPYSGSDNIIHIDILRLDYNNGTFQSVKSWNPNLAYPASFSRSFTNQVYVQKLSNGNYGVYGELFGDWFQTAGISYHFGVLELNANDDFVQSYYISSPLTSSASGTSMVNLSPGGRLIYSFMNSYAGAGFNLFMGSVQAGNVLKERMLSYTGVGSAGLDLYQQYRDGSYSHGKTIHDLPGSNYRIEYLRLHDSDTGSVCLGIDSVHASVSALNYVAYNTSWTNTYAGALTETNNNSFQVNPLVFNPVLVCTEKNACDSIRIHGVTAACNTAQLFTFTSYRDKTCGTRISWNINPTVVQTFQVINDTTVQIQFNQNWQGWLYASINTSCGILKDSVLITVSPSPGPVNLGPDRDICVGNSIVLNAHQGYAAYLWNTGGVDSTITVTTPGTYYVDVQDACGNTFSDTIQVNAAPPVPVDLGPDRQLCNNDTLQINAPPGFVSYAWGPSYYINTLVGQQVVVQPLVDTIYFVKATNAAGCFGVDTIRVRVNTSPPVQLGPDQSFCSGDSTVLNAGPGFSQYLWSNGSAQQQITVYQAGQYSVTATATNGCRSADTIRILQVWPSPVVSLNKDSLLCAGSQRVLSPGSFISYLWQDGTTASSFTATAPGIYYVSVRDNNGCKGSDTTRITKLLPLPAAFLPADTSVCEYYTIKLSPLKSFTQYLWSTGEVTPAIVVAQPGTYWLQVSDGFLCKGRDTVIVNPRQCLRGFYIPTGFTPNRDGRNDLFMPVIGGVVKAYRFTVYNRWGERIFTTDQLMKGWDGTFGGITQDGNVFVWTCMYQLEGEQVKYEKGTVVLIR